MDAILSDHSLQYGSRTKVLPWQPPQKDDMIPDQSAGRRRRHKPQDGSARERIEITNEDEMQLRRTKLSLMIKVEKERKEKGKPQ